MVRDGEQAIAFLRREGVYADAVRPHLILLDLKTPRKSGLEVLAEIKPDPDLRRIPVIVLTTSTAESDILGAYNAGANCMIVKPFYLKRFARIVEQIEGFWLTTALLPSR